MQRSATQTSLAYKTKEDSKETSLHSPPHKLCPLVSYRRPDSCTKYGEIMLQAGNWQINSYINFFPVSN